MPITSLSAGSDAPFADTPITNAKVTDFGDSIENIFKAGYLDLKELIVLADSPLKPEDVEDELSLRRSSAAKFAGTLASALADVFLNRDLFMKLQGEFKDHTVEALANTATVLAPKFIVGIAKLVLHIQGHDKPKPKPEPKPEP